MPFRQQERTFHVEGAVERPGDWTVTRIQRELSGDVRPVRYTLQGDKAEARCVPLLALVQAARPKLNPKAKNHLLAFTALVQAEDGYTVSFSLGELQSGQGDKIVFVALDRNGQPLTEFDGPVRMIVPDESRPARWVHGIACIVILDGITLLTK